MSNKTQVYYKSFEQANELGEVTLYRENIQLNNSCARDIKSTIDANFNGYYLNDGIAQDVIDKYGQERVNMVLANTLQRKNHDGRFSRVHKEWAKGVALPDVDPINRASFMVDSHPAVLDGFIKQTLDYERGNNDASRMMAAQAQMNSLER